MSWSGERRLNCRIAQSQAGVLTPVRYKPLPPSPLFPVTTVRYIPIPPSAFRSPSSPAAPSHTLQLPCRALLQTPPVFGSSTSTGHYTHNVESGTLKERVSMSGNVSVLVSIVSFSPFCAAASYRAHLQTILRRALRYVMAESVSAVAGLRS